MRAMNNARLTRAAAGMPLQADALQPVASDSGGAVDGDCCLDGTGTRVLTGCPEDEGAGARDASPLKQNNQHRDCAGAACGVKRFATLQAHLALAGFSLTRAADGYYVVARWNQTRNLVTLEQVEQFHRRVAP